MTDAQEPPMRPLMEEVQESLDSIPPAVASVPAGPPGPPPTFKRRLSSTVAVEPRGEPPEIPAPAPAPAVKVERFTDVPENEEAIPYRDWIKQKSAKYDTLLRSRTTPDFIDFDALNTVMSEFGGTFIEVSREARLWADKAQDAKDLFDSWWATKVTEAQGMAAAEAVKITSDSGLARFAESKFSEERSSRLSTLREAERRAEFLGTLKLVVQNTGQVLRAAGPSLAFVWGTSGGLTIKSDGTEFRGMPARRIEERPAPDALIRARRARFEGKTS